MYMVDPQRLAIQVWLLTLITEAVEMNHLKVFYSNVDCLTKEKKTEIELLLANEKLIFHVLLRFYLCIRYLETLRSFVN